MAIVLTFVEARVLGCLIEKSVTTPEYYPLTLNSLVSACNQKSNREPVMRLGEEAVSEALDSLRFAHHLVWEGTVTGSRTPKYKHDAAKTLGLSGQELAVLCVLMLRGTEAPGQLRARTGRLCEFTDLGQVLATLQSLREHVNGPFVMKLPREPGSREPRYAHLLCGEEAVAQSDPPVEEPAPASEQPVQRDIPQPHDRVAALEQEVNGLRAELAELKAQLAAFRQQFE